MFGVSFKEKCVVLYSVCGACAVVSVLVFVSGLLSFLYFSSASNLLIPSHLNALPHYELLASELHVHTISCEKNVHCVKSIESENSPFSLRVEAQQDSFEKERQERSDRYIEAQRESIQADAFGNSLVDISTPGYIAQEWLYSNWPVFYPSQEELKERVQGCASGGFYVSVQATASVIVIEEYGVRAFHYRCEYMADLQQYLLLSAEPAHTVKLALEGMLKRYSLPLISSK